MTQNVDTAAVLKTMREMFSVVGSAESCPGVGVDAGKVEKWAEQLESALPPQPKPGELWEFDVEHSELLGFILDDGTVVHEFGGRLDPICPPIRRLYPPADHPESLEAEEN